MAVLPLNTRTHPPHPDPLNKPYEPTLNRTYSSGRAILSMFALVLCFRGACLGACLS